MTVDARGTVRLFCQSPIHTATNGGRSPPLGDVPAVVVRFAFVLARLPNEPDGRLWLRCTSKDCRAWNCFEWCTDGE